MSSVIGEHFDPFYYSMLSVCHFCIPNGVFVIDTRLDLCHNALHVRISAD